MIQKFICWFFGHKTIVKAYTGDTIVADGAFDRDIKHLCYRYERLLFCVRCGTKVHND